MKTSDFSKWDLEKGTQEEVKSLGKATLFLSGNSAISVEFNAESCLPRIKPNGVYFLEYLDRKMKSYSVDDKKVQLALTFMHPNGSIEDFLSNP